MSRYSPTWTSSSILRLPLYTLICGACGWLAVGSPATAQWFGKKFLRKPPASAAAPAQEHGFAAYIRRLTIEAQTAANRGDYEAALHLAERAHKVSQTCQAQLTHDPDCAPAKLELLIQRYRAAKNDEPASAVNPEDPNGPIDLAPLLDHAAAEPELPIPPTPAASRWRKKSFDAAAASQLQLAAAKLPASDPLTALGPKRRPEPAAALPERETGTIVLASDTSPPKFTRRKTPRAPEGFLIRQSRWLNPDTSAQELINAAGSPQTKPVARDERAPGRAILKSTAARRNAPRVELPKEDAEVKPAIATATDRAGARWQLDLARTAAPLPAARPPAPAKIAERIAPSQPAPRTESTLGVWQSAAAPIVRATDTPGMIETDFRHVTVGERESPADVPRTLTPPPVSRPTLAPTLDGPPVRCRDDATSVWDDPATERETVPAPPLSAAAIPLVSGDWTPARQTLLIGVALVIAGLALFGLSFRWK
jgi:hypothetical protein